MSSDEGTEGAEGIVLLGAEMLTWSDLTGEYGPSGGPLLTALVGAPGARTLMAGPHAPELVAEIATRAPHLDVVVRSYADAQALRAALPEQVRVFCGPVDRLPEDASAYSTIVALDGLDRLPSFEEAIPSWELTLGHLTSRLAEDGQIFVGVGNEVGINALTSTRAGRATNANWPSDSVAAHRPTLDEVRGALGDVTVWSCFGPDRAPRLAVAGDDFTDVAALVPHAYPPAGPAYLQDPVTVSRRVIDRGLGARLAPSWVVSTAAPGPATVLLTRPDAVWALTHGTDAWQLDGGGTLPLAPSLDQQLATGLMAHDEMATSALVRTFASWLGDSPTATVADASVTLDQVTSAGGRIEPYGPRSDGGHAAPRDVVLLRALTVFAADFLQRTSDHPFEPSISPRFLAGHLAAAAGIEQDDHFVEPVRRLDLALTGVVRDFRVPPVRPTSIAEMTELLEAVQGRLADQDEQLVWLVRRVHARQRAFRAARGENDQLRNSTEFRLGRRLLPLHTRYRASRQRRAALKAGEAGIYRNDPKRTGDVYDVEPELLPPGYKTDGPTV